MSQSENISPTALITGHMWLRFGLSHPALATSKGRWLDRAFGLLSQPVSLATGLSFDDLMRARHRGIDDALRQRIDAGKVTQVIELAAGLSPRGWRICQQYGDAIHYIETDLPDMVQRKRQLLDRAGLRGPRHDNRIVNALHSDGPESLAALVAELNPNEGLAIITEGLINYLDPAQVEQLWQRIAQSQKRFAHAVYLSDFYLSNEIQGPLMQGFRRILERYVRGRMHVHNASVADAEAQLARCGFEQWQMPIAADLPSNQDIANTSGARRVRILQASVQAAD